MKFDKMKNYEVYFPHNNCEILLSKFNNLNSHFKRKQS